jgi:chemotaxis protein methyltransferase CheR
MQVAVEKKSNPYEMSYRLFCKFRTYVESELGIKMPDAKKTMLQARLQKRLRKVGVDSFEEYYDYVFSSKGKQVELQNMIDVVTTNKTDFFREPRHFDFLTNTVLPDLIGNGYLLPGRPARIWSAGCSNGKEPYTLAMVLSEFFEKQNNGSFSILATDISSRVLKHAAIGIYDKEDEDPIPMSLRKKHLLRSKDPNKGLIRIVPELRAKIRFQQLNFMDDEFDIGMDRMHIIFCRNVIIYFDHNTQEKVLNRLCRHLIKGGYIFMGHSETLNGLRVPLSPVFTTVYKKTME